MKTRLLILSALVAVLCAGCGKKDETSTASTPAAAPASSGPRTVELTAGDNMKFNVNRIEVAPGEQVTIVLTNIGNSPRDVMGHNWILLKAGTDVEAFDKAASAAKESDYFPAALKDQVLAHIPLLGPRKSDEVTFKAPTAPGEYVYLCSFPAHYAVGMKGVLVVK